MNIITNLVEANSILKSYIGATVHISMYTSSLKRLALKLEMDNNQNIIYMVGVGCEHITGNFYWKNCNLAITVSDNNNEIETKFIDKGSNFTLVLSGGFVLAQGLESEFGTSFDDLIR